MTALVPTHDGRLVPLAGLLPGDVSVRALAAQLSALALWHGATAAPYHPAQRAVLMSETFSDTREALHALLWPAPMAFLGVIEPAVRAHFRDGAMGFGAEICQVQVEGAVRYAVAVAAGIGPLPAGDLFETQLAQVERVVIATELRDLGLPAGLAATLGTLPAPLRRRIQPWPWDKAEQRFLRRWRLLAEIEGLDPDQASPAGRRRDTPGFGLQPTQEHQP